MGCSRVPRATYQVAGMQERQEGSMMTTRSKVPYVQYLIHVDAWKMEGGCQVD